jgi:hypothetical protein
MLFNFLVMFYDSTQTQFTGKFDVEIDIPYDSTLCASLPPGTINPDGLLSYTEIPSACALATPTAYQNAINSGDSIGWTFYGGNSATLYGPTAPTPPNTPPTQIQTSNSPVLNAVAVPYQTAISSSVVRVGERFSEGYANQMPLSWGCGTSPCGNGGGISPLISGAMQGEWTFSEPFTVQMYPALLAQYDVLPAFILYQPPGDQSVASFSITTTYTQQLTSGSTVSITDTQKLDDLTTFDYTFGGKETIASPAPLNLSESGNYVNNNTWDQSVSSAMGSSYGDSISSLYTEAFLQQYTTPTLPTSTPPLASLTFYQQPFWSDWIYYLIHPQFAIWVYPHGTVSQPLGTAALDSQTVKELSTCAAGNPISEPYSLSIPQGNDTFKTEKFPFTLTAAECANLLQMDPFWVGLTQAATPPMGIPVNNGHSVPITNVKGLYSPTQITQFTTGNASSETFNTTLTATESQTYNTGNATGSLLVGTFGYSGGTTVTGSNTQQFQLQLNNTQSETTEQTMTPSITLQDCPAIKSPGSASATDNCGVAPTAAPIPIQVFQDNRFGTMLAQTPTMTYPNPPPLIAFTPHPGPVFSPYPHPVFSPAPVCLACLLDQFGYGKTQFGYGFPSGQVPTAAHAAYNPALVRTIYDAIPVIRMSAPIPRPLPSPRTRHVQPLLPIAYAKSLPNPQNLSGEMSAIVVKFPKVKGTVTPPPGRVYPRSGTLQPPGADGRPRLVTPPP